MAKYEFKLPDIGEGIAEAEIVAWHVKVGDTIAEDQQIADMMTDKATVEMESPVAGKVVEARRRSRRPDPDRLGAGGDRDRGRSARPKRRPHRRRRKCRSPTARSSRRRSRKKRFRSLAVEASRDARPPLPSRSRSRKPEVTERACRPGQGPRLPGSPPARPRPRHRPWPGEDHRATASATPTSTPTCSTTAAAFRAAAPAPPRKDETIKVVGLRRKIAENMQEAKRRIPHFTLVEEFDVTDARRHARDDERATAAPIPS